MSPSHIALIRMPRSQSTASKHVIHWQACFSLPPLGLHLALALTVPGHIAHQCKAFLLHDLLHFASGKFRQRYTSHSYISHLGSFIHLLHSRTQTTCTHVQPANRG